MLSCNFQALVYASVFLCVCVSVRERPVVASSKQTRCLFLCICCVCVCISAIIWMSSKPQKSGPDSIFPTPCFYPQPESQELRVSFDHTHTHAPPLVRTHTHTLKLTHKHCIMLPHFASKHLQIGEVGWNSRLCRKCAQNHL